MSAVSRIDKTGALQILPEKLSVQNLPAFIKGESLKALVLTAKGSQITLKTSDGRLFSANILSDTELMGGENVELIVKENTGGRIILQLFSTEEQAASVKKAPLDLTQFKDNGQINAIVQNFQQLNMKLTPAKLQTVLNIMKDYPSLNEKAAVFFTANSIPVNKSTVAAVNQLINEKTGVGENLIEIVDALMEAETKQANSVQEAKLISDVNNPVYYREGLKVQKSSPDRMEDIASKEINETDLNSKDTAKIKMESSLQPEKTGTESKVEKDGITVLDKKTLSYIIKESMVEPLIVKKEGNPVKTALWPQIEPNPEEPAEIVKTMQNEAETMQGMPENSKATFSADRLIAKILSAFANLDEFGSDELKKISSGTLQELNLIKEMVRYSDVKNRDDYVFKISELISREKLTSDINRYICMHIPVIINQRMQTAEVYVYRRNKKGKKIDKENTVVYLGLDTNFMGRVETVIQIDKKNVSLTFKLENEKASSMVKDRTTKLFKELQAIGYKLTDTKFLKLTKRTTVIDAEEELIKTVQKKNAFIDYKI